MASRRLKLLCVDDEPDLLSSLGTILASAGYEIVTASSADEAIDKIKGEHERLVGVISDLKMPGLGGLELRKRMLPEFKSIPFLVLSGYIDRETALSGLELKISSFIEKPFQKDSLLEILQKEVNDRIASLRENDELLDGFISEAQTLLEEMESLILGLEESPQDIDAINRIFACAHTVKGASGYFEPKTIYKYTHEFEDFLSKFKNNVASVDSSMISTCLKALDQLRDLLMDLNNGSKGQFDFNELTSIFNAKSTDAQTRLSGKSTGLPAEQAKQEELRISLKVLDQFMERSGEITVLRNMMNKVLRSIEAENPANFHVMSLVELFSEMHKANSFMQDQIEDLRKMPLRQVFKPLSRTLRDLAVSLKKQINFEVLGGELRVDHSLSEVLSKCLIHMLRNAADHGIETPEARIAAGKPPQGSIRLNASISRDEICVQLADDGKGIDVDRVLKKAIDNGILTPENAKKMSPNEIHPLIFHPGLSTAEVVTDISGRGVGADMVKRSIEEMGGRIDIESKKGHGTLLSIYLPIPKSVLIISSLMIRVGKNIYAIPRDNVLRILRPSRDQISYIAEAPFIELNGNLMPIAILEDLLSKSPHIIPHKEIANLVVIQCKFGIYCLAVDDVRDIEDTVVKELEKWAKTIRLFLGATFLEDGHVGLILDAEAIGVRIGLNKFNLTTRKDDESWKSPTETSSLVFLFDAGDRSLYGIPRSELFRLEEFNFSSLQKWCDKITVIYRNQVMPIYPLLGLLDEKMASISLHEQTDVLRVIVVRNGENFVGLSVNRFYDFVSSTHLATSICAPDNDNDLDSSLSKKVITLLEVHRLLDKLSSDHRQSH